MSIIQGCINFWQAPSHIIDCGSLLDVVDPHRVLLPMWIVPRHMFLSTTPTFQGFSLCVVSITWIFSEWFISTLGWKILLIHTSGRKDHPRALTRVLKFRGFKPLLLESRIVFLLPFFMGFCLTLESIIEIPCFSNSIF
jgi:hypothetical protein